jgi:hypothetical protein
LVKRLRQETPVLVKMWGVLKPSELLLLLGLYRDAPARDRTGDGEGVGL